MPSPEERKAEFAKPEPAFVLPALTQRISSQISGLESWAGGAHRDAIDADHAGEDGGW
ncbi:hypothetical protein SBA6_920009 [Candidatus Sulfopaludibacter sp. SbA6]|nr:hypothetical protein SBA6_920009 [Candidatus Sulfopaludibacter sp. SbA6]